MKVITRNTDETSVLAKKLANVLRDIPNALVLLVSDLGGGKTTLSKGIINGYGIKKNVTSPTFTILKSYENEDYTINHLDLYRLEENSDVFEIIEYIYDSDLTIVEWPYNAKVQYNDYLEIKIKYIDETTREFTFEFSEKYNKLKEMI